MIAMVLVGGCAAPVKERPLGENEEVCYAKCKLKFWGQDACMQTCARRYYDYFIE